ncbi:MAG: hypothetical protein MRY83_20105 [Flavobacteriales bacterium]|nr:hypothetical protein [Flavobacteriales bacterium]
MKSIFYSALLMLLANTLSSQQLVDSSNTWSLNTAKYNWTLNQWRYCTS